MDAQASAQCPLEGLALIATDVTAAASNKESLEKIILTFVT
jgi:hypothetical protein